MSGRPEQGHTDRFLLLRVIARRRCSAITETHRSSSPSGPWEAILGEGRAGQNSGVQALEPPAWTTDEAAPPWLRTAWHNEWFWGLTLPTILRGDRIRVRAKVLIQHRAPSACARTRRGSLPWTASPPKRSALELCLRPYENDADVTARTRRPPRRCVDHDDAQFLATGTRLDSVDASITNPQEGPYDGQGVEELHPLRDSTSATGMFEPSTMARRFVRLDD